MRLRKSHVYVATLATGGALIAMVHGCASREGPSSGDLAQQNQAIQAYAKYAKMVKPSINFKADVSVVEEPRPLTEDLRTVLSSLQPSDHFVPYRMLLDFGQQGGGNLYLEPAFAFWGRDGYPPRAPFARTEGAMEDCPPEMTGPTSSDETPLPLTAPGNDTGPFKNVRGAILMMGRQAPAQNPSKVGLLQVALTIDGTTLSHRVIVLYYADQRPLLVDYVLLGINNHVTFDGTGPGVEPGQGTALRETWTKLSDGCHRYSAADGNKLSWSIDNCFGHIMDVWVRASLQATMTCAWDGTANKCIKVSDTGTATADGQGGSYLFWNWYAPHDAASQRDTVSDANGNAVGVDFSLGAESELYNNSSSNVTANLMGQATGKVVGGSGSVTVEMMHGPGSYGGVTVKQDSEIVCPPRNWNPP